MSEAVEAVAGLTVSSSVSECDLTLTPPTRRDEGTINRWPRRVGSTIWGWVRGAGRGIAQPGIGCRAKVSDSLPWAATVTTLSLLAAVCPKLRPEKLVPTPRRFRQDGPARREPKLLLKHHYYSHW